MLWNIIYNKLKSDGFDVYTPGQHKGDCLSPYVVVCPSNTIRLEEFSSNVLYCEVLCYVPQENFSNLEPYVLSVKQSIKHLYPQVRESHFETSGFADSSNKSHMWSIQYQAYQQFFNF